MSPTCLEFGPNDSKVVLKPRHGYIPKVLSTPSRAQIITLSALPPSEEDQELNLLSPVRALKVYVERSAPFRQLEQLFVCFAGRTKGHPVMKQKLSHNHAKLLFSRPTMPHWCTSGGHGPVVYALETFVQRLSGPRRPHLQDFIKWRSLLCIVKSASEELGSVKTHVPPRGRTSC